MPALRLVPAAPAEAAIDDAVPDAELVERARGGERWAAAALYRRHVDGALRLASFLLRRRSDAEDAVQDAFVVVLSRLGELREPAAFGGWLGRIVANAARGKLRKRRLLGRFGLDRGEDDVTLDGLAAASVTAAQRAELAWLDRAVAGLPDGERIAWTLRFIEGWELLEIAESLGVSLATAKRRLKAAKERVGEKMGHPMVLPIDEEQP